MAHLSVYGAELSVTKKKAIEDAKKMQLSIADKCTKNGYEIPQYTLTELIGKGSFGRVYKGVGKKTNQAVAVKIIDIEESDLEAPKFANTMADLVKEIGALKRLAEGGAKNINVIVDAFNIGHSMWMITEYCAGGSVATLMRPTAPGGLHEKWIIPILREVAEATYWVHKEGIIHRDIKCANVLVTEAGGIQLCDFGVAGFVDTRVDKRTTFIGTLHWMAPEMFERDAKYATEVDIWAFGAMAFEVASGLPPNVAQGVVDVASLGNYLRHHTPRLEGDQYSPELKNLVEFCLELDPKKRPVIEQVQDHPYLRDTADKYPTSTLSHLIRAYRLWEAQGGSRKSLFAPGGAQAPSDPANPAGGDDEWNFSSTAAFDQEVLDTDAQAMYDVYGDNVFNEETERPQKPKPRRRMPPHLQSAPSQKAPIEKIFDPNTITNYGDYSRDYYNREMLMPLPEPPKSDLPLRNTAEDSTVRESLIDLDASLGGSDLSRFADIGTLKANQAVAYQASDEQQSQQQQPQQDYTRPPLSDPADMVNNRRTQDWKFPSMGPLSANPEVSRFPMNEGIPSLGPPPALGTSSVPEPMAMVMGPQGLNSDPMGLDPEGFNSDPIIDMGGYNPEPVLAVDPPGFNSEPVASVGSQGYNPELTVPRAPENRASVGSLIDLDEGLVDIPPRPSTANSDVGSISGSEIGGANPFEFERHASLYNQPVQSSNREPSIYVSDNVQSSNREPSIYVSDDSDYTRAVSAVGTAPTQVPPPPTTAQDIAEINDMAAGLALTDSGAASRTQRRIHNYSMDSNNSFYGSNSTGAMSNGGPSGYGSDSDFPVVDPTIQASSSTSAPGQQQQPRSMMAAQPTLQNAQQQQATQMYGAIPVPDGMMYPPPLPSQLPLDVLLGQVGNDKVKIALAQSIDEFKHGLIHASQKMAEMYHVQRQGQQNGHGTVREEEVGE